MANLNTLQHTIKYIDDLDLWAIDRPISISCVHQTSFCAKTCYNVKLYKAFGIFLHPKDVRNEQAWQEIDSQAVSDMAEALKRKVNGGTRGKEKPRGRFMSRGEALSDFNDIPRVRMICEGTPKTMWWLPTRAWRNPILFAMVLSELGDIPNLIIQASMDPSNTAEEWEHVKNLGLGTMFYGNDEMIETPNGDRMFKCPKTWKRIHGHCNICKAGCFNTKKRVDVHLKKH